MTFLTKFNLYKLKRLENYKIIMILVNYVKNKQLMDLY